MMLTKSARSLAPVGSRMLQKMPCVSSAECVAYRTISTTNRKSYIKTNPNSQRLPMFVEGLQGEMGTFSPEEGRATCILKRSLERQGGLASVLQGVQDEFHKLPSPVTESEKGGGDLVYDTNTHTSEKTSLHGLSVLSKEACGMTGIRNNIMQGLPPSRRYGTSASVAQPKSVLDIQPPCPQGVQGEDCEIFKVWLQNCQRYGLANCDEQYDGLVSGRKTLQEIFHEQDLIIKEVAMQYKNRNISTVDAQGVQGDYVIKSVPAMSMDSIQGLQDGIQTIPLAEGTESIPTDLACPQGIQGDDCQLYKLWVHNCIRYGHGDCREAADHLHSGRKSLRQIFAEQEKTILQHARPYSTSAKKDAGEVGMSQKDRLKKAVKEYGATVVVFHISISLMSLGGFYLAVSSGLDIVGLLSKLGVGESMLQSGLATGASTFVVAYAVHKVFAPVRIGITLTSTPLIVRYLRNIGMLKKPSTTNK